MTGGDHPSRTSALHIEAIAVGPIDTNAYLVGDPVRHVPGHAPGHVVFVLDSAGPSHQR